MTNSAVIVKKARRKPSEAASYLDFIVFLIPALQFVRLKVVGTLTGSDIVILLAFIVLFLSGEIRIKARIGRKFLILCSLWLLSQIVTDLIKHSAFADYARGWSAIGLTFIGFSVMFSLIYGSPRRITIYTLGMIAGGLLASFVNPSELAEYDIWKFGLALPVTLSVLLIASRKEVREFGAFFLTASIGIVHFLLGSRSIGEFCLGAAVYILVAGYLQRKGFANRTLKNGTIAAIAVLGFIGLMGTYMGYQYAVISGMLGDDARKKFEEQSSGDYGVLLGGRVEMLSSVPAIIDSPILGHGSFARDPKYLLAEQQALAMMGYKGAGKLDPDMLEEGLIPTHSHLLGSWVNAGILGGLIWAWVWLLACKMLLRVYPSGVKLLPLAAYAAFDLLWEILFSPYGLQARVITPFYAIIIMSFLGIAQSYSVKEKPARAEFLGKDSAA
jgi:hypothetical protein